MVFVAGNAAGNSNQSGVEGSSKGTSRKERERKERERRERQDAEARRIAEELSRNCQVPSGPGKGTDSRRASQLAVRLVRPSLNPATGASKAAEPRSSAEKRKADDQVADDDSDVGCHNVKFQEKCN